MKSSQDKPTIPVPNIPVPKAPKPQPELAEAVESWEGEGGKAAPAEDLSP